MMSKRNLYVVLALAVTAILLPLLATLYQNYEVRDTHVPPASEQTTAADRAE